MWPKYDMWHEWGGMLSHKINAKKNKTKKRGKNKEQLKIRGVNEGVIGLSTVLSNQIIAFFLFSGERCFYVFFVK